MYVLSRGLAKVGVTLGPIVGEAKILLFANRPKIDEISRVGKGVMVPSGEGTAVGVIGGYLSGMLIGEDDPVRWLDISSLALIARTGEHTITSRTMDTIKGEIFILIPREIKIQMIFKLV